MAPRLTLTVPEAAELIGISRTKGYELARRGELPCLRFGHRLLVPLQALLAELGMSVEDWLALTDRTDENVADRRP